MNGSVNNTDKALKPARQLARRDRHLSVKNGCNDLTSLSLEDNHCVVDLESP